MLLAILQVGEGIASFGQNIFGIRTPIALKFNVSVVLSYVHVHMKFREDPLIQLGENVVFVGREVDLLPAAALSSCAYH